MFEDKNISLEKQRNSIPLHSLQPSKAPLLPSKIRTHLKASTLQPMRMALQPMKFEINEVPEKTPALRNIMFELTLSCNLNCIHCYCSAGKRRKDELEIDEIKDFVHYLTNIHIDSITFTGGEPLTHRNFLNVAKYASEEGLDITVFTNGELLDSHMLKEFSYIRIKSIQISLDGAKPETHDLIRGKKGLFRKTVQAIKESKAAGFPVIIMTTLVEQNQKEVVEISELCEQWKVDGWCMNMFLPLGRATYLNPIAFQKLSEIRKHIGVSPAICNSTACGVGFEKIAVLSNGSICPCEVVQTNVMGNIREDNLLDIFYNHPLMKNYRKSTVENISKCSKCPVNLACKGGCKSSALTRNGSIFSADPTGCYSWGVAS